MWARDLDFVFVFPFFLFYLFFFGLCLGLGLFSVCLAVVVGFFCLGIVSPNGGAVSFPVGAVLILVQIRVVFVI